MSKKINVSIELMDAILKYIQTRPLAEVWNLFVNINQELSEDKISEKKVEN